MQVLSPQWRHIRYFSVIIELARQTDHFQMRLLILYASTFSYFFLNIFFSSAPLVFHQSLGCLLYAICFFKSPYDSVFERGDSVALAVQSNKLTFPVGSLYSTDMHNLITWMLTPELAVRPHLSQIIDKLSDMEKQQSNGALWWRTGSLFDIPRQRSVWVTLNGDTSWYFLLKNYPPLPNFELGMGFTYSTVLNEVSKRRINVSNLQ